MIKKIIINICMFNLYFRRNIFKENKKFESYVNHLIELEKMTRSWLKYKNG